MAVTFHILATSFRLDGDTIEVERQYQFDNVETGLSQIVAALPAVGATFYSSKVKCHGYNLTSAKQGQARVSVLYRTEQIDDLIETAASGTIIDKGMSGNVENVLRTAHPTSGATFLVGGASGYIASIQNSEPRLEAWWDKVHTSYTTVKNAGVALLGAVNNDVWNTYAANKWLCVDMNTRTVKVEGGDRYLTRYSFTYKPEGWVGEYKEVIWNGRTISAITAATAVATSLTLYRNTAFVPYGFTF